MQGTFESDPGISSQLSLYRQNGSKVIEGDLITLPVAGGLIYEEPFYIQAASTGGGTSTGSESAAVRNYLAQAESDYAQAQAALKHGDLGSYQKYIAKMKTALDQAQQAAKPHG